MRFIGSRCSTYKGQSAIGSCRARLALGSFSRSSPSARRKMLKMFTSRRGTKLTNRRQRRPPPGFFAVARQVRAETVPKTMGQRMPPRANLPLGVVCRVFRLPPRFSGRSETGPWLGSWKARSPPAPALPPASRPTADWPDTGRTWRKACKLTFPVAGLQAQRCTPNDRERRVRASCHPPLRRQQHRLGQRYLAHRRRSPLLRCNDQSLLLRQPPVQALRREGKKCPAHPEFRRHQLGPQQHSRESPPQVRLVAS